MLLTYENLILSGTSTSSKRKWKYDKGSRA